MQTFTIESNLVDIEKKEIYPVQMQVRDGKISSLKKLGQGAVFGHYLLPGFVDAHVHIESSMLIPSEFARLAVVHGTVGTVSDPHEIANVCGIAGVDYMINNGNTVPFHFNFGAPSCVPATVFETAGAAIDAKDADALLSRPEIKYLTEMMNFPGVLNGDEEVMKKIAAAKRWNKPADGHAPGLRGDAAKKYIEAGISTDHECFTSDEALDKLSYGMKILIREGSAAKNFEALIGLLPDHPEEMMFCSDDKHPDSLADGHINQLCQRAVAKGINLFEVLQAACINPVKHYKLDIGLLKEGEAADFIMVKDLVNFEVVKTFIKGKLVAENGKSFIEKSHHEETPLNQFRCSEKTVDDFIVTHDGGDTMPVIEALDGQLITNKIFVAPKILDRRVVSDVENDILKIAVVNRYQDAPLAVSFIRNFGLKSGAIASSVAHDSHNIVAVGTDDESICRAVNLLIREKGGISCVNNAKDLVLPLPVAGLMSMDDGYIVAENYKKLDAAAKQLGSGLSAPFMTLSFMALLVIPHLKLSDKGLFDGDTFSFCS